MTHAQVGFVRKAGGYAAYFRKQENGEWKPRVIISGELFKLQREADAVCVRRL